MKQLKNTLSSTDPINLGSSDESWGINKDMEDSFLIEAKTKFDERLDYLYDIVERLEYRVVDLENKLRK